MCSKCLVSCVAVAIVCAANGWAQASRITQTIDNSRRATLAGHLHPKAQATADQGRVAPSLPLPYITLTLAPAASQQADLQKLLSAQQTKGNSDYHHWLTPEEYAHRFGRIDASNQVYATDYGLGCVRQHNICCPEPLGRRRICIYHQLRTAADAAPIACWSRAFA
jgi:hypothetical protein